MTAPDRRSTPATARVALRRLRGTLARDYWTDGEAARVAVPLTDLCRDDRRMTCAYMIAPLTTVTVLVPVKVSADSAKPKLSVGRRCSLRPES